MKTSLTDALIQDGPFAVPKAWIELWDKAVDSHRRLESDRARLIEALEGLRSRMKELDEPLKDFFTFCMAHNYLWPPDKNWKAETDKADALLRELGEST